MAATRRSQTSRTSAAVASTRAGSTGSVTGVAIVDYKTGNAPSQKYSAAANAKIRRDAFFQLYVYALLLREGANDGADTSLNHVCLTNFRSK